MQPFNARAYWEDRLARSTGLEGVGYLGLGQPFNAWMYRSRRAVFKRVVKRSLSALSGSHVLDVGSGTGEYIRSWQELGVASVSGSDLTETSVAALSAAFKDVPIMRVDITEPTVQWPRTYDAVSCMDVLFHVVDDEACQQSLVVLRKALRKDGILFLSENFVHASRGRETHFTQRPLVTYEQMLQAAGFTIEYRVPMFHLLNAPIDSRSPWMHRWWSLVMGLCKRSYMAGGALAMLVYPLEQLLVRMRREGVSTELMVCRAV